MYTYSIRCIHCRRSMVSRLHIYINALKIFTWDTKKLTISNWTRINFDDHVRKFEKGTMENQGAAFCYCSIVHAAHILTNAHRQFDWVSEREARRRKRNRDSKKISIRCVSHASSNHCRTFFFKYVFTCVYVCFLSLLLPFVIHL